MGCSKRTLRLPEDGNIVRRKIQAGLRLTPEAPETQRPAAEDHRRLFARHPAHRQAFQLPDRQPVRAATDRLLQPAIGRWLVEHGQARPLRLEVLLRARLAQTLGGARPDQATEVATPARHHHHR